MKVFQTKAYKVIIGYVYGWGATAVIIGALFKIMHFPYAGLILTVGMLVEAFIFFVSAFEPAMEHYDWARVFPVLGKSGADWDKEGSNGIAAPMGTPMGRFDADRNRYGSFGCECECGFGTGICRPG